MRRMAVLLLAMALMVPAFALAEGPVLLMDMPENVQMVENVMFDDGDFIQTYQLSGMNVHLARYGAFDMSLEELVASEWAGAENVTALSLENVGGYSAMGVSLSCPQDGAGAVDVTIILVDSGAGVLVFEAIAAQGDTGSAALVESMINSMDVLSGDEAEVG